eukprot:3495183-Rhodomonas_salina.1
MGVPAGRSAGAALVHRHQQRRCGGGGRGDRGDGRLAGRAAQLSRGTHRDTDTDRHRPTHNTQQCCTAAYILARAGHEAHSLLTCSRFQKPRRMVGALGSRSRDVMVERLTRGRCACAA